MKGLSLFSSAGIGEYYLARNGIDIIVANELLEKRANLHKELYPQCEIVVGDITDEIIYNKIIKATKKQKIDFIIASPPCQGMSVAGKNRKSEEMSLDNRNYLILSVIKAIKDLNPDYIIIENVPLLLKLSMISFQKFLIQQITGCHNIEKELLFV